VVWEERVRARRVALLAPYNLNFHLDGDGYIQLIFFNGRYADDYPAYLRSVDPAPPMTLRGHGR